MYEEVILVGGGGHSKVVISILKKLGKYKIIGISDTRDNIGKEILGIPVKFTDDDLPSLYKDGVRSAIVTVGSTGFSKKRMELFDYLKSIGFNLLTIVSKDAIVDNDTFIDEGTVVMAGVIINPGVKIGKNCIINTGSIIEHDCTIGDHVHIAPGVTLCGGVTVGFGTHIGAGATVIQGVRIGKEVVVGAGAVVLRDVPDKVITKGVPAKW